MNFDVLDEQLLNSSWWSCSISIPFLIHVFRMFYKSKILCIEVFSDPKCVGKDLWDFRV